VYVVFVDESGNTGSNLLDNAQPYHYIGGVVVQYDKCLDLQEDIEHIAEENSTKYPLPDNYEFKGSWLYSGNKFFSGMNPEQRIGITEKLLNLIPKHQVKCIISIIDKAAHHDRYRFPIHPQNLAFLFFLEMFQEILDRDDKYGMVVADEEHDKSDDIILDFKKYRRQGTGFSFYKSVELTRILDNVHFVKSHDSWIMQLSDVMLYHYNKGRNVRFKKYGQELSDSDEVVGGFYDRITQNVAKFKLFP
jgi:hypothetical protein